MSLLPSIATRTITVAVSAYVLRMFIVDESTMSYVAGTIKLDGVPYSTPTTGTRLTNVTVGMHTIQVVVPANWTFSHWVPTGGAVPVSTIANPTDFNLTANGDMIAYIHPVAPVEIATSLTISAPSTVDVGESFTVSGRLTRADTGAGIGDADIIVSYDGWGDGILHTAPDGTYILTMSIPTAAIWTLKAEFLGTPAYGGAVGSVAINVGAVVPPVDLPVIAAAALGIADVALVAAYLITQATKVR